MKCCLLSIAGNSWAHNPSLNLQATAEKIRLIVLHFAVISDRSGTDFSVVGGRLLPHQL
jgi:hypothetical protein